MGFLLKSAAKNGEYAARSIVALTATFSHLRIVNSFRFSARSLSCLHLAPFYKRRTRVAIHRRAYGNLQSFTHSKLLQVFRALLVLLASCSILQTENLLHNPSLRLRQPSIVTQMVEVKKLSFLWIFKAKP